MPHGGGHHHHSGGVHHNHGRSRHHNDLNYAESPFDYRRRHDRRWPCSWFLFSIALSVTIILSTTVTVHYTASNGDADGDLSYGPTDTRIISVSNVLCEEVTIQVSLSTAFAYYNTYLYILSSPPKLTGLDTFSLNVQPSFDADTRYQHYHYFMPRRSNFSMSACVLDYDEPGITFYVVKGQKNFENWKKDGSHSEFKLGITADCETSNDTYAYSVTSDDFYYLVFDSEGFGSLNVTMHFHHTRYEVDNGTVIDSCSLTSGGSYAEMCHVQLPLSGSATTLLKVAPPEGDTVRWLDKVGVETGCSARTWVYVVFGLAALVGTVGILVVVMVSVYCLCKCGKKRMARARASVIVYPPLLTDPLYPQSSTSYGSIYAAPPAYKDIPPAYKE